MKIVLSFLRNVASFFVSNFCNYLDFLAGKSLLFLTERQDTRYDRFVLWIRSFLYWVSACIHGLFYDRGTEFYMTPRECWKWHFCKGFEEK